MSIRSFRTGLLTNSSLSALSPIQQYQEARSQFSATVQSALGGDLTALGNVQGVSQTFLTASRAVNASSAAYATDFNSVQGVLSRVENFAAKQGGIDLNATLVDVNRQGYAAVISTLKDEIGSVRDQLSELNATIKRQETKALVA